jgi:hypothetical protein
LIKINNKFNKEKKVMSGQPNLCVDIFSAMGRLLANFNGNQASADSEYFSHDQGFVQSENISAEGTEPVNFEDQVNQHVQWLVIGAMVLFLIYQQLSSALPGVAVKNNRMGPLNNNNGGNPPGGVL